MEIKKMKHIFRSIFAIGFGLIISLGASLFTDMLVVKVYEIQDIFLMLLQVGYKTLYLVLGAGVSYYLSSQFARRNALILGGIFFLLYACSIYVFRSYSFILPYTILALLLVFPATYLGIYISERYITGKKQKI